VLSELSDEWAQAVSGFLDRAQPHASVESGYSVDGATQYFFFQTLVGAFPLGQERALLYMQKAIREARLHTSWTAPSAAYEAAVERFVRGVLDDSALMDEVADFVRTLAPHGYTASLGKTLVRLTVPGVPDVYQGSELWDLRLVDPDNRSDVDFELRRASLARVGGLDAESVMQELDRGTPKLWLIAKVLGLRAARPALFEGAYVPLGVQGQGADAVLGFGRGDSLVTVVPRWPVQASRLGDDVVVQLPAGTWQSLLTDERFEASGAGLAVRRLWARFPVSLLTRLS
jgi:(1->4)-alpha-D-glucan 1-alpha-D-glucosylmutase